MTDTDLSFLIASRICHDLINPIGAIHNGLELMTLSQSTAQGIEFDLVQASANDARARAEFFRLAFGSQKHGVLLQSDALKKTMRPVIYPATLYSELVSPGCARSNRGTASGIGVAVF